MASLRIVDLGCIGYEECLALQRELVEQRHKGEIGDTLLLLEHPPVMTTGTGGGQDSLIAAPEDLARAGISIHKTDRGGDITYHGPGQLVGYPIFDLRNHGKDAHLFLRNIEQSVIGCLSDFGIDAHPSPGYAGVWVGDDKICSIGIAVRRWISYHGFALNVNPDFAHWALIHPCGLVGKKVTSIQKLIGRDPGMAAVKTGVVRAFERVFEYEDE